MNRTQFLIDGDPIPGDVRVKVAVDLRSRDVIIALGNPGDGVTMILSAADARQLGEGIMAAVKAAEKLGSKGKG